MPHHSLKDFLKVQSAVKERSTIDWLQANKGAAEIHMMELAECIYDAINESKPIKLLANQWHIPYSDKIDLTDLVGEMKSITKGKIPIEEQHMTMAKIEVATVMCARVSYTTVDHDLNTWSYEKYLKKYHDMKNAIPITHNSSPFEHCNKAMNTAEYNGSVRRMLNANGKVILDERGWVDNFRGFISLRKQIELQDGRAKNANRDFPLN